VQTEPVATNGHPSGDPNYATLDQKIRQLGYEGEALLEVLNTAQELFGYLSEDLLIYVAAQLQIPLTRVYGVATFYHMFTFSPLGEHNCIVCTGTACHVKGADKLVAAMSEAFDVAAGQTTADNLFSLTTARCLGSCGLAPVVVLDGDVRGKETAEAITRRVQELLARTKEGEVA
jgi:bidirectional [NiFe] hydrogenase diaphorase subunit